MNYNINIKKSLKYVYQKQKELTILGGIGSLLGWDQMTYMPSDGAVDRAEQIAFLSKMSHRKISSEALWRHLQYLSRKSNFEILNDNDQIAVSYTHLTLPTKA